MYLFHICKQCILAIFISPSTTSEIPHFPSNFMSSFSLYSTNSSQFCLYEHGYRAILLWSMENLLGATSLEKNAFDQLPISPQLWCLMGPSPCLNNWKEKYHIYYIYICIILYMYDFTHS